MKNKKYFWMMELFFIFLIAIAEPVLAQSDGVSVTIQRSTTFIHNGMERTREFFARFTVQAQDALRNLKGFMEQSREKMRQYQALFAEKQRQLQDQITASREKSLTASEQAKNRADQFKAQQERNRQLVENQKAQQEELRRRQQIKK